MFQELSAAVLQSAIAPGNGFVVCMSEKTWYEVVLPLMFSPGSGV